MNELIISIIASTSHALKVLPLFYWKIPEHQCALRKKHLCWSILSDLFFSLITSSDLPNFVQSFSNIPCILTAHLFKLAFIEPHDVFISQFVDHIKILLKKDYFPSSLSLNVHLRRQKIVGSY